MNKKRKGFTLAEIILVLAIVGIIILTSLEVYRVNRTAYTSLAYYAHKNLKEMVAEMMADEALTHVSSSNEVAHLTSASIEKNERTYNIYEKLLDADNTKFIQRMMGIANTQGSLSNTSPIGTIDADTTPNFTTTNGQQYFIGAHQNGTPYGYRTITVDLNGTAGPNSTANGGSLPADRVSFLVFDNGEVFPDGVLIDNTQGTKYLRAKLKGFNFDDNDDRDADIIPINCKKAADGSDLTGNNVTCNYGAQNIENGANTGNYVFNYRDAYCNTVKLEYIPDGEGGQTANLDPIKVDYCKGVNVIDQCPPSKTGTTNAFDKCTVELIKPMFRFNFN